MKKWENVNYEQEKNRSTETDLEIMEICRQILKNNYFIYTQGLKSKHEHKRN